MKRADLLFIGACILVRDPDGGDELMRLDSSAAMRQAVVAARMMLSEVEQSEGSAPQPQSFTAEQTSRMISSDPLFTLKA